MGTWEPIVRVDSNRTLELNRGNPVGYIYTLPGSYPIPTGAYLTIKNDLGQTLDVWTGTINGRAITFSESAESADLIPRGASWTLMAELDGVERLVAQGTVIRREAPFPGSPLVSEEFQAVQYRYIFATPGRLVDPAWQILEGSPWVYDNSDSQLPNAVAAGNLWTGEFWPSVFMLYYAPLHTDSVRLRYNTIRSGNGECWVAICSNSDASNYAAIYHKQASGSQDQIAIVTGAGKLQSDLTIRQTENEDTENNQHYVAEYNPVTNTYSVYLGDDTTPLVSWEDSLDVVAHGPGERYFGLGFKSALLTPGVEISDVLIQDAV